MNKSLFRILIVVILFAACDSEETPTPTNDVPLVKAESSYTVLIDEDVEYAEGLAHTATSTVSSATPLLLDVYYPDNSATNRPVCMFIMVEDFKGAPKQNQKLSIWQITMPQEVGSMFL